MALVNCPDCGKRMSTMEAACPQCGRRADGTRARRAADSEVESPEDWLVQRTKIAAGLLIGGFLLPILISGFGETHVIWPWSQMSGMRLGQVAGTLATPLLGAAALIALRLLSGKRLAATLAGLAGGVWVLTSILAPGIEGTLLSKKTAIQISVFTIMPLCACAIAVGNHLRKAHPKEALPRTLAATGGGILLSCFLLPEDGSPLIGIFFQSMAWHYAGPIMVLLLGLLLYAVLGCLSPRRFRDEASFTRLLSILARTLLWGGPFTLLVNFGFMTAGWGMGMAFLMTLKYFAMWYGHWILIAAALATWMDGRLRRSRPTASRGSRELPTSPPAGPART